MSGSKAAVFRTIILSCAVVSGAGCGASRNPETTPAADPKVDVVQPATATAPAPSTGSALPTESPNVTPPPPSATPDLPDDKLAEHYGITVGQLKHLRKEHAGFPSIKLPARASDRTKKLEGLPDHVVDTGVPGFRVIRGPEISGVDSVTPAQIGAAALALKHLAFKLKIPVFTRPLVFLDFKLDDPNGRMSVVIGLPVPNDVEIPKSVHTRVVPKGKAHFFGRIDVKPLDMPPGTRAFLAGQLTNLAPAGKCNSSLMVILDEWPGTLRKLPAGPVPPDAPVAEPDPVVGDVLLICL